MPTPADFYDPGSQSLLPPTYSPTPPPPPDNDPTKTQTAAVPRVPPPTPAPLPQTTTPSLTPDQKAYYDAHISGHPNAMSEAEYAQYLAQQNADNAAAANAVGRPQDAAGLTPIAPGGQVTPGQYSPVPWQRTQPPPALPVPPVADWDHEDEHPDPLRPYIRPQAGPQLPNREPDHYSQGQPVYNLRPGEQGYGQGNMLSGIVAQLESGGGRFAGLQPPGIVDKTYGQKLDFTLRYGSGPQGVTNFAQSLLRTNPNINLGDFYASYALGHPSTLEDLRTQYPDGYRNLINNANTRLNIPISDMLGPQALPGTPSGPQGPWSQSNLEANFAERTGQLGQAGNVPLTTVTSPNGQKWEVNQRVAPQFQGFLNDLDKAGYHAMISSGGYANRPIRGGTIPSEHAYGAAIDIGAEHNPLQYVSAGGPLRTDLPSNVGEIAAKWGLKWGGTFTGRQDPMHFEVAALMTPQQLEAARNSAVSPPAPSQGGGKLSLNTPLSSLMGGTVAGPRQHYMRPEPRDSGEWGRPPEADWNRPGHMPQAHDMPGIMHRMGGMSGIFPLAIGLLLGGPMGAVAAFAGYQNARNAGQLEQAKRQRTRFQDRLKESTAMMQEELLDASGIIANYGYDTTSPGAREAWQRLASFYGGDRQLQAAIDSGDPKAIERLFKDRDVAFQTLHKASASETKAEQQEETKRTDAENARKMGFPDVPADGGGGGGGPAAPRGLGFETPPGSEPPPPQPAPPTGPAGVPETPQGGTPPAPAAGPAAPQATPPAGAPTPEPAAAPPTEEP